METWNSYTIEEIAAPIKNALVGGPFGSNLVSSDYVNDGVPVIRGQNMGFGRCVAGQFAFVSEEKAKSLNANIGKPNDVVFTQRGTLGQVALIPDKPFERYVISQSQMKLTVDQNKADATFIYYLFSGEEQKKYILQNSIQTGVPHTNLGILRKTPVKLPPIKEQRRIAEILSTLDEKIELNLEMNRTLERIAQATFKHWFVDFQFPDFDGEFVGGLPKGWRSGKLGDISTSIRKSVNPKDVDSNTPYFGLEHLPQKSIALTDWGKAEDADSLKSRFSAGDILFGKIRPYFHKVGIAPIDGICSTDILVIQPKRKEYFGLTLTHFSSEAVVKYATLRSNGAKMPRTNWNDLADYEIVIPQENIAEQFSELIISLTKRIKNNIFENRTLTQIRDGSLPKLMSGKIRVTE